MGILLVRVRPRFRIGELHRPCNIKYHNQTYLSSLIDSMHYVKKTAIKNTPRPTPRVRFGWDVGGVDGHERALGVGGDALEEAVDLAPGDLLL